MRSTFRQGVRSTVICAFIAIMAVAAASVNVWAQTHVVSPAELRQQMLDAARTRAANIETVKEFISTADGQQALRIAHLNPKQVQAAVSTLSDAEVAQLSARAAKAQRDFAAGDLSDRDLLLILIGIAALILIIVAVR
jgi:hypothetical protein